MRDQIAKLAEAQKEGDPVDGMLAFDATDFPAILAEFDRLSKIEAAARAFRKRYLLKRFEPAEIHLLMAGDALDAALAPSTGKPEKPDG